MAATRRKALDKLAEARHEVLIRGPEGEQIHYDEKGKRVKGGRSKVLFPGYERYMRELAIESGDLDPELEKLVEEIKRADAFWGETPAFEPNR